MIQMLKNFKGKNHKSKILFTLKLFFMHQGYVKKIFKMLKFMDFYTHEPPRVIS